MLPLATATASPPSVIALPLTAAIVLIEFSNESFAKTSIINDETDGASSVAASPAIPAARAVAAAAFASNTKSLVVMVASIVPISVSSPTLIPTPPASTYR